MESTRPIRALVRGLDALTFLNSRDSATVSEIARAVSLPRTTVHRILETFCEAGYVSRATDDERFHVSAAVRGLSNGFADDDWVIRTVLPAVEELGRDLVWPVCFTTRDDAAMLVRVATDHATPLATDRLSAGCRLPIQTSAAGRVYLAYCAHQQRDALLAGSAPAQRDAWLPLLGEIRTRGYDAVTARSGTSTDAAAVAVPVPLAGREPAALSVRFVAAALPLREALQRFVPKMRRCAARISNHYGQQRDAGGIGGTSATAS